MPFNRIRLDLPVFPNLVLCHFLFYVFMYFRLIRCMNSFMSDDCDDCDDCLLLNQTLDAVFVRNNLSLFHLVGRSREKSVFHKICRITFPDSSKYEAPKKL